MKREGRERRQVTSVAMQDVVDHAWDAEIAAMKDGAAYGTLSQDQLLPNMLIFWECTSEDASGGQGCATEFDAIVKRFNEIASIQDSRMGRLELAMLDQRLCMEEEGWLLSKLQQLAHSRQSGTASPSPATSQYMA